MAVLRIFLLITLVTFLIFSTSTAAADGAPCSFSGTIKLDDSDTSGSTLVTATIERDEYHTYATEAYGSSIYYYLTIRAPQGKNYPDGTKVDFKVNGHPTEQTAIYKAGSNIRLDLTASSKAVKASLNTWLTILLTVAIIVAVGLVCYLLFRIMVKRRRLAEPVTAVQAEKIEPEPRARYIWDSDKLAWVQATEPTTGGSPQKVPVKSKAGVQQSVASSLVTKKPAIKRNKVAKSPRRDTSLHGIDT